MDKKINVILTCMGGYGSLTLLEDFLNSDLSKRVNFIGTHADPIFIARSPLKTNYLVPSALKEAETYIEETKRIIEIEDADLIIPKSDAEVRALYPLIDKLGCKTFLPDHKEIHATQDKLDFYKILEGADVPAAKTLQIQNEDSIPELMSQLRKVNDRFWLRIKTAGTAGAYGATWVKDAKQAKDWIEGFCLKESVDVADFTLSEFLPGRLFEILLLFKNGELKLAKIYENLRFANGGDPQGDGVGSTPDLARSISDDTSRQAMKNAIKAIEAASIQCSSLPNGVYHMSAKENYQNEPCITEVNIGRTPSTVSIFNRIGKYNLAEYFLHYALNIEIPDPEPLMDIASETYYAIRSLDQELCIRSESEFNAIKRIQ